MLLSFVYKEARLFLLFISKRGQYWSNVAKCAWLFANSSMHALWKKTVWACTRYEKKYEGIHARSSPWCCSIMQYRILVAAHSSCMNMAQCTICAVEWPTYLSTKRGQRVMKLEWYRRIFHVLLIGVGLDTISESWKVDKQESFHSRKF
jgi:hypothetical protein